MKNIMVDTIIDILSSIETYREKVLSYGDDYPVVMSVNDLRQQLGMYLYKPDLKELKKVLNRMCDLHVISIFKDAYCETPLCHVEEYEDENWIWQKVRRPYKDNTWRNISANDYVRLGVPMDYQSYCEWYDKSNSKWFKGEPPVYKTTSPIPAPEHPSCCACSSECDECSETDKATYRDCKNCDFEEPVGKEEIKEKPSFCKCKNTCDGCSYTDGVAGYRTCGTCINGKPQ